VGRRQEAAIKLALGAPRGRLIREFLKESAVLFAASGVPGYCIAAAAVARYSDFTIAFPTFGAFSFRLDLRLDATVAGFALVLLLMVIVTTGLAPALYASSPGLAQILSGEIAVGGTRKAVRRNTLVVSRVAICTLVLVGMGLCQRNLYNLLQVDPGFSARNLVAVTVSLAGEGYTEARGKESYETLRRTVSALPGVESISPNRRRVAGSSRSRIMRGATPPESGIEANSTNYTVMTPSAAGIGAGNGLLVG
jgi:hypothetical protein